MYFISKLPCHSGIEHGVTDKLVHGWDETSTFLHGLVEMTLVD